MSNELPTIEIKAVKADEVSFTNKLEPGETIRLGFKYNFNIVYSGGDTGRGQMTLIAENTESPEKFSLKITESGIFNVTNGSQREAVHVAAFRAIFPYAKALAAMVSSASGVPAVMIPEIKLSAEDVVRIDYKPPHEGREDTKGSDQ